MNIAVVGTGYVGLSFEICYFFNVYGPRQIYDGNYATVVSIFEKQFKEKRKLTVVKPGTQSRDFTPVFDIVQGVILTLDKNMNHEWHLKSNKNVSIIELAEKYGEWEFIDERRGERFTSEIFTSDTNSILNWTPKENLDVWVKKVKNK